MARDLYCEQFMPQQMCRVKLSGSATEGVLNCAALAELLLSVTSDYAQATILSVKDWHT